MNDLTLIEFANWVTNAPEGLIRRSESVKNNSNIVIIIESSHQADTNIQRTLELSDKEDLELGRFRRIISGIEDERNGLFNLI